MKTNDMVDRCECCDLPVESCGLQVEIRQRQQARREKTWGTSGDGGFEAKYPGTCHGCGERYEAGVMLVRGDDGWQPRECCG